MKNKIVTTPSIAQFIGALNELTDNAERICQMLVQMVDANPAIFNDIVKAHPHISYNLLGNMERVGRGQMYSGLLFDSSPAARSAAALSTSQQKAFLENPVKIIKISDGKTIVSEKAAQQLSRQEVSQVIDISAECIRDVDEQIKYLKNETRPASRGVPAQRYRIVNDRLIVSMSGSDTEFDITTLESILERMKAVAIKTLSSSMKKNQIRA